MKCRHCRQTFEPRPDKKGFVNECPECEAKRYTVTQEVSHEGAGPVIKMGRPPKPTNRPKASFRAWRKEFRRSLRKKRRKR